MKGAPRSLLVDQAEDKRGGEAQGLPHACLVTCLLPEDGWGGVEKGEGVFGGKMVFSWHAFRLYKE